MKKRPFKIILFLTTILACLYYTVAYSYTFEKFQIQFGKVYENEEDKLKHKLAFEKNYQQFLELRKTNPHIQINKFLDLTDQQKKNFFNYKHKSLQAEPLLTQSTLTWNDLVTPPDQLDYRNLNKVTPIKDQQYCGSCWAFVATAAYESQILIHHQLQYDLAEQYLLQCEPTSFGCQGGYEYNALKLLNLTGAPLQTKYPYRLTYPSYIQETSGAICMENAQNIRLNKSVTEIGLQIDITDELLTSALATYGPLIAGIGGSDYNFLYVDSAGIVDNCRQISNIYEIDHAVLIVGYTSTHWIIKNSWGTNWGDQGYGYISRINNCGLTKHVTIFITNSNLSPVVPSWVPISIYMNSWIGNDWGDWILGIQQNGNIIHTFTFDPNTYYPIQVYIYSTVLAKFVVVQNGTRQSSKNIYFALLENDQQYFYSKGKGFYTYAYSTTVFTTYCASLCMPQTGYQFYYLWLSDLYGDGWSQNVIQFKQKFDGSRAASYGEQFLNGFISGPYKMQLKLGQILQVSLKFVGNYRQEIGYKLVDKNGQIVSKWTAKKFAVDTLLQQDCTICGTDNTNKQQKLSSQTIKIFSNLEIGLISGIGAQGLLSIILIASLIWTCRKNYYLRQAPYQKQSRMQTIQQPTIAEFNNTIQGIAKPTDTMATIQ